MVCEGSDKMAKELDFDNLLDYSDELKECERVLPLLIRAVIMKMDEEFE